MDGFSYVDIFTTKGIEYLVVIAYFILFALFLRTLGSTSKKFKKSVGRNDHEE